MEQGVQDEFANSVLGKGNVEADARNATQTDNGASQFDDTISEVQSRHRALKGPSHLDNQFVLSINPASPIEQNKGANTKAHRHNAHLLGNDLPDRAPPPSESGFSEFSQWTFCSIQPVIDRGNAVHMTWEESHPEKLGHSTSNPPSQGTPDIEISRLDDGHMEPLDSSNHTNGATMEHVDGNEDANRVTMESADDSEDVDSIENRICSSLVTSAFDAREYLPIDQLCKILSPSVVHHLLLQYFGDAKASEYEREVLGTQDGTPVSPPRRRRILAILVLIDQVKRLPKFIEHGVDDTALPFHFAHIKPSLVVTVSYMPHLQDETCQEKDCPCQNSDRKDQLILKKFDVWPCRTAKEFTLWQSIIHVPFLKFPGDRIYFYDLYQDSTLPFDLYELQETGGYGSVRKVTIHPSHYNCHGNSKDQESVCLAVKRLHTPNVNDYLQEIDIFDKLGAKIKDPLSEHLIPLQLTFKHGKDYFLMFPWADGNLKQLWRTWQANPEDPKQVCWFMAQCSGIVSGLRRVHHISTRVSPKTVNQNNIKEMILGVKEWGRHGDIKPENILWFKNYNSKQNHLVISDFGLTQFNSANSRSKVQQGQILGFSGTYRPPDLHVEDQPISQNYDVWSLGCVFLEFVSWFLLGYSETVVNFSNARLRDEPEGTIGEDTFFVFENGHHGMPRKAKLKDSVVKWINKLHKMDHCSEPLHALLDLIQFTMLVPNSKDRWKSDSLNLECQQLKASCNKSSSDLKGTPGSPNPDRYLQQPEKPQTQNECASKLKSQESADIDTCQNETEESRPQPPSSSSKETKTTPQEPPPTETRSVKQEEFDNKTPSDRGHDTQDEALESPTSRFSLNASDKTIRRPRGTDTPPTGLDPVHENRDHQLDGSGSQFDDVPRSNRYRAPQDAFEDFPDSLREATTNDINIHLPIDELPEAQSANSGLSIHTPRFTVDAEPYVQEEPPAISRHLPVAQTDTHKSSRWQRVKKRLQDWWGMVLCR